MLLEEAEHAHPGVARRRHVIRRAITGEERVLGARIDVVLEALSVSLRRRREGGNAGVDAWIALTVQTQQRGLDARHLFVRGRRAVEDHGRAQLRIFCSEARRESAPEAE